MATGRRTWTHPEPQVDGVCFFELGLGVEGVSQLEGRTDRYGLPALIIELLIVIEVISSVTSILPFLEKETPEKRERETVQ
jgi:hypothetical protein